MVQRVTGTCYTILVYARPADDLPGGESPEMILETAVAWLRGEMATLPAGHRFVVLMTAREVEALDVAPPGGSTTR